LFLQVQQRAFGMTVLPEWLIGEALANDTLARVLPEWALPPVDVRVAFPSGRLPNRLRTFVDFAVSELPKYIGQFTRSL
jgi:DNA-binding transcriptional LysR family regulator